MNLTKKDILNDLENRGLGRDWEVRFEHVHNGCCCTTTETVDKLEVLGPCKERFSEATARRDTRFEAHLSVATETIDGHKHSFRCERIYYHEGDFDSLLGGRYDYGDEGNYAIASRRVWFRADRIPVPGPDLIPVLK